MFTFFLLQDKKIKRDFFKVLEVFVYSILNMLRKIEYNKTIDSNKRNLRQNFTFLVFVFYIKYDLDKIKFLPLFANEFMKVLLFQIVQSFQSVLFLKSCTPKRGIRMYTKQ